MSSLFSRRSLLEEFAAVALRCPDAIAVQDGQRSLSYGELDARSVAVARGLAQRGVAGGDRVGVCVERGAPAVLGILGVLRRGAAYVPLDPEYPPERLEFMCEDAEVKGILSDAPSSIAQGRQKFELGELLETRRGEGGGCADVTPGDLAYVIYTSGSTGRPKGVMVTHGNISALVHGAAPMFDLSSADRWSLFSSYSFDVSVWEMWMALRTGARMVSVSAQAAQAPDEMIGLLQRERVTVLNIVPSVFARLVPAYLRAGAPDLSLRYVIFAGEALDRRAVREFEEARTGRSPRWINMYGITETTVHATFKELQHADIHGSGHTPVGRSLPHLRIVLRDDEQRPVRLGEIGEMWLAGPGVAAGYLNAPALTQDRFREIPIDGVVTRAYRSGDLAVESEDGELAFVGRVDQQVKLRGFRIELGEVEQALCELPGIAGAAAAVVDGPAARMLVGLFVVELPGQSSDGARLRRSLEVTLPRHMIPNRLIETSELPLSPAGKLDRAEVQRIAENAIRASPDQAASEKAASAPHAGGVVLMSEDDDVGSG